MAGITQAQAEAKLAEYLAAESAVLSGQAVTLGDRSLRLADLAEIRAGVRYWDERVKTLSAATAGRGRSRVVAPGW